MPDEALTRPERAAQIRQAKRYRSAIQKRGLCSACKFRQQTLGIYHCRNWEDRQHGNCETDKKLPYFEFDPDVLKEFADAA